MIFTPVFIFIITEILWETFLTLNKCYVVCVYVVIIVIDLWLSGICKLETDTVALLLVQNDGLFLSWGSSNHSGLNLDSLPLCLWFQGMIFLRNCLLFNTDLELGIYPRSCLHAYFGLEFPQLSWEEPQNYTTQVTINFQDLSSSWHSTRHSFVGRREG